MTDSAPARPALAYAPPGDPPIDLARIVSVHDFEAAARERLHPAAWEYYQGGAWDGTSLRDKAAAYGELLGMRQERIAAAVERLTKQARGVVLRGAASPEPAPAPGQEQLIDTEAAK